VVTPQIIEERLYALSTEVDTAHADLIKAERGYHKAKSHYEIVYAKAYLSLGERKMRVQELEKTALLMCATEYQELHIAEAIAKAARGNAQRIRTQVDIARSIGTSVRASLDI
jgi:hypothetical protein